MTRSSVLILSGFTENVAEVGLIARANHQSYALKHGYEYQCITQGFHPFKHPSWSKVLFLYQLIASRNRNNWQQGDWVFWIDADAVITNFSIRLESFISNVSTEQEMVIGEDAWGINAGLWFLKKSPWCEKTLVDLWRADPLPFVESGVQPPIWIEQPRYLVEQSTLWHLLNIKKEVHKIKLVPYSELGGYLSEFDQDSYTPRDQAMLPATVNAPICRTSWQPGDFALHLAGVPNERKVALLSDALR